MQSGGKGPIGFSTFLKAFVLSESDEEREGGPTEEHKSKGGKKKANGGVGKDKDKDKDKDFQGGGQGKKSSAGAANAKVDRMMEEDEDEFFDDFFNKKKDDDVCNVFIPFTEEEKKRQSGRSAPKGDGGQKEAAGAAQGGKQAKESGKDGAGAGSGAGAVEKATRPAKPVRSKGTVEKEGNVQGQEQGQGHADVVDVQERGEPKAGTLRPGLGIKVEQHKLGVTVTDCGAKSVAYYVGVNKGDVISHVNGLAARTLEDFKSVCGRVIKPRANVTIVVKRLDENFRFSIKLHDY